MEKKPLDLVAMILLIVGGLNWGLYGAFRVDLVQLLFGWAGIVADIVYIVVGISAIYGIAMLARK